MTMALLGLLAWKAFKHLTAGQPDAAPAPQRAAAAASDAGQYGQQRCPAVPVVAAASAICSRAASAACSRAAPPAACFQRRARRSAQAVPAGRPRRDREHLGRQGREQADRARRSRQRPRRRPDQPAAQSGLSRDELLSGLSQYLPRGDRPPDAGRTAADRERALGQTLIERLIYAFSGRGALT